MGTSESQDLGVRFFLLLSAFVVRDSLADPSPNKEKFDVVPLENSLIDRLIKGTSKKDIHH